MMIDVGVERISPQLAKLYLEKNKENRPLNNRKVDEWLQSMNKGLWETTTDAIGFDTNGNLINGQHRLTALIRYGKPLEFLVARNLSPTAFAAIDTGKSRSAGDVLGIQKFSNANQKAGIIRVYCNMKKNRFVRYHDGSGAAKMNNQEVLEFAMQHVEQLDEVSNLAAKVKNKFKACIHARYVGALYWVFSELPGKQSREQAMEFFNMLATGENLSKSHPVFVLRNRLISEMASRKNSPDSDMVAWTIITWNAYRKGKPLTNIRYNPNERDFPKPI